jgi:hypothetical protein
MVFGYNLEEIPDQRRPDQTVVIEYPSTELRSVAEEDANLPIPNGEIV